MKSNLMKQDVLIYPRDYPLLLDEIRLKGSAYRRDRSGQLCELVFDLDNLPHRRDQREVYTKWQIESLEDLALVISFMEGKN